MASLSELRAKLQSHPKIGLALAGGCVVIALVAGYMLLPGQQGVRGDDYYLWVYNAETKQPELRLASELGPDAITAHVFACGSCSDAEARFVGFVSRIDDEHVRPMDDETYYHPMSEQGQAVTASARQRCDKAGKPLRVCPPLAKYR